MVASRVKLMNVGVTEWPHHDAPTGARTGGFLTSLCAEQISTPLKKISQLGGLFRVLDLVRARMGPLQGLFDLEHGLFESRVFAEVVVSSGSAAKR